MDIKISLECTVLCLVFIAVRSAMAAECVEALPENCTCTLNDDDGSLYSVKCNNSNFGKFPDNLPPAMNMHIENDNIEILTEINYNYTIKYMSLMWNRMRFIKDGAFKQLTHLERLYLSHNEITGIRKETFQGLTSLNMLVLVNNPLYHINVDTFDGKILPQLDNLDLSRCELFEIEDGAIDSLTNLMTLSMAHNHLKALPALGCSSPLEHLVTWDLSNNEISDIHKQVCPLPKIQDLYLAHNRLETLNAAFLGTAITNLRMLNLKANRINYVDPLAFLGSNNLTLVDLSYNQLVHLEEGGLPWDTLVSLYIHDNPWFCGCSNLWLVHRDIVADSNNETTLRCGSPDHLTNESVFHLHSNVFNYCGGNGGQIAAIAVTVIIIMVVLVVVCFVVYRRRSRREYRQNNTAETSMSTPGVGRSNQYRKMDNDTTELAVSYSDLDNGNHDDYRDGRGDVGEPTSPVWKEMSSINYQSNKPCHIV